MFYNKLQSKIDELRKVEISVQRRALLQTLIDYIQWKVSNKSDFHLNYICTHNSRRSQFSQVWSEVAAAVFGVDAPAFSGGVEVTEFNERAINSLKRFGFEIETNGGANPVYQIHFSEERPAIKGFSKLFDDSTNPKKSFAAVMTCSHADENCPFIPGTEKRIALNYEDPKAFDGTPQESKMYDERSDQIGSELLYVFGQIKR